jgi:hypothetical protein
VPFLLNYSCATILPFETTRRSSHPSTRGISGPARRRTESKARPASIASIIKLADEKRQCQLSWGAARDRNERCSSSFSRRVDDKGLRNSKIRIEPASTSTPIPHAGYSLNTRSSRQPPLGISSFQPIKATRSPRASSKRTSSCFSRGLPIWLKHSCWPIRRRASQR